MGGKRRRMRACDGRRRIVDDAMDDAQWCGPARFPMRILQCRRCTALKCLSSPFASLACGFHGSKIVHVWRVHRVCHFPWKHQTVRSDALAASVLPTSSLRGRSPVGMQRAPVRFPPSHTPTGTSILHTHHATKHVLPFHVHLPLLLVHATSSHPFFVHCFFAPHVVTCRSSEKKLPRGGVKRWVKSRDRTSDDVHFDAISHDEVREIAARNAHVEGWNGTKEQGETITKSWKEERGASWRRKRRKEVETGGGWWKQQARERGGRCAFVKCTKGCTRDVCGIRKSCVTTVHVNGLMADAGDARSIETEQDDGRVRECGTVRSKSTGSASNHGVRLLCFGCRHGNHVTMESRELSKRMAHPSGEIGMVKAASTQGNAMILSTMATTSMEEVAEHSATELLFQLYVLKDRNYVRKMVQRAERAGFKGIVVTVDAPVMGNRERDKVNRFTLPGGLRLEHLVELSPKEGSLPINHTGSALVSLFQESLDQSLTWDFIGELRTMTALPIIVKGVLTAEDAEEALSAGVDAIIVSNHGGRQLDFAPATLDVLPEIVNTVRGRVPIWVDGGIRRGTDVLKCIALGASAVLIGRPVLYGLAVGGQAGVERVLELLHEEIKTGMALLGTRSIKEIGRSHVGRQRF